jgi:hypothetical protein
MASDHPSQHTTPILPAHQRSPLRLVIIRLPPPPHEAYVPYCSCNRYMSSESHRAL